MGQVVPLSMLAENEEGRVVSVRGGYGFVRRLAELGLNPGVKVKMLRATNGGPLLIHVRGSRIALGRGVAMHVLVEVEG
ncbi:MAG TPA: ferrous iron transport protein A [Methanomicrobia archaeon]|nr:Fe2+ transport protein FeoA [Candidatus Alkanophaga volatiphilum]HDO64326.1 ferrous iron transport protein A [Methanomicrobia archaeon]HEX59919.1 ferrous iron transport protein A [Methanomicrobia archaeon]